MEDHHVHLDLEGHHAHLNLEDHLWDLGSHHLVDLIIMVLMAHMDIVDLMDEYNIGYGSVNHNRNRCMDCGYEDATEGLTTCPRCGSKHIDTLQRITGYLVGTTDRWNSGKLAELHDRVVHK